MRIDPRELKITQTGAIFFALVNQGFASMSSLRVFIDERAVFEHESKRGAYGAAAYFATKSAAEAPFQLGFATVFAAIAYALIGLKWTAAAFTQHLTVLSLATLVAESLALAVGAAAADAKTAVVLCPVALSTSLLFGGFLVKLETLPALLKPLQHLSFFKHAFAALLKIEFTGLVFECSAADKAALSDRLVAAGAPANVLRRITLPCPTPDGETYLERTLGASTAHGGGDLLSLLALLVAFRLLAYLALKRRTAASTRLKALAGAKQD